jgi:hypothetical protein
MSLALSSKRGTAPVPGAIPRTPSLSTAATRKSASPHDGSRILSSAVRIAQSATWLESGPGVKNAPRALRAAGDSRSRRESGTAVVWLTGRTTDGCRTRLAERRTSRKSSPMRHRAITPSTAITVWSMGKRFRFERRGPCGEPRRASLGGWLSRCGRGCVCEPWGVREVRDGVLCGRV